jgi:hypothetical protein
VKRKAPAIAHEAKPAGVETSREILQSKLMPGHFTICRKSHDRTIPPVRRSCA